MQAEYLRQTMGQRRGRREACKVHCVPRCKDVGGSGAGMLERDGEMCRLFAKVNRPSGTGDVGGSVDGGVLKGGTDGVNKKA